MSRKRKSETVKSKKELPNVSFFPAWCKRCGNCVAFCPKNTLETDEWGYPYVARPESCISCHLCEKLCPDFAITVGEKTPPTEGQRTARDLPADRKADAGRSHSPERVARTPKAEEENDA
ncbi:MAG: 4Fe-4S binding protein [Desulfomonile tiedjei]|nr:4Fe-4S binding protein [Desulfomonile tiedjei]